MPVDDTIETLIELRRMYHHHHKTGVSDKEVAAYFGVSISTVCRWRQRLDAHQVTPGRYTIDLTSTEIDYAEAVFERKYGMTLAERILHRNGNGKVRTNSEGEL